ncbi:terminase large subunit, partial [Haemophilus seminalis]|uniref:terminase TerL endonuclease subunit n=1 Tax=Haemophilus seminalis TaxID=2582921 RepID=UPI002552D738|nr:terminase large subunit [Haemophilus seminalis]
QKIAHAGHPVLRWNMDNIFIRTDPAGNIKCDKEKSTEKIDGAIATIMARNPSGIAQQRNTIHDFLNLC